MFKWINNKREGLKQLKKIYYYKAGEIFEPEEFNDINKLYMILKNKNFSKLKKAKGEFAFFIEDEKYIYAFIDEVGTIEWYYYHKDGIFLISNSFWDIVKTLKISIEDIDKNAVFESIILNKALNEKNFIKDIKNIKGGEIIIFNKSNGILKSKIFSSIEYNPMNLNEIDAIYEIDMLFNKTLNKIREFNPKSKFGITISGGLDSRFPLPYIKQNEVSSTYLMGKKNNLFSPIDYDSAKAMAKLYNLKFEMIDPFVIDIFEKVKIDILRNPTTNSNIMKALNYEKLFKNEFNVLLTGAYGGLIGGRVLSDFLLNFTDINDLSYKMFEKYSIYSLFEFYRSYDNFYPYTKYIKKIFNILKNNKKDYVLDINKFLSNDFLIDRESKLRVFESLKKYLTNEYNNVPNNLSLIMRYHLSFHSIRGSFESLHGQVKSYSIYHPYIYHFSKNWPIEFLSKREIMEKFLLYKYPKLAAIPLQGFDLPISYKYKNISIFSKLILRTIYLEKFLLKRLAINYTTWWNTVQMKKLRQKVFEKDSYFYSLFNKEDVLRINKIKTFTHLAESLLKTKILIDSIENNLFVEFEDNFKFSGKY